MFLCISACVCACVCAYVGRCSDSVWIRCEIRARVSRHRGGALLLCFATTQLSLNLAHSQTPITSTTISIHSIDCLRQYLSASPANDSHHHQTLDILAYLSHLDVRLGICKRSSCIHEPPIHLITSHLHACSPYSDINISVKFSLPERFRKPGSLL